MSGCPSCGRPLPAVEPPADGSPKYCPWCGARRPRLPLTYLQGDLARLPDDAIARAGPTRGPRPPVWLIVTLVVAGVVGALIGTFAVRGEIRDRADAVMASPSAQPTTPSAPPASPGDQLAHQAVADRPALAALVGGWVPQIASKAVGTVALGRAFSESDILAEYRALRSRYTGALLLRSDDFTSFRSGYWVTVMGMRFPNAAAANAWCAASGRGADDCFAKLLSHTAGPAGATVHR